MLSPIRMNYAQSVVLLLSFILLLGEGKGKLSAGPINLSANLLTAHFVTNVAQLRILPGADFLAGCDFRLRGVITLVDSNRDLVVLQDATGAVALHFRFEDSAVRVGTLVTLEGENCVPYFPTFPAYPHHPSERNVLTSFESLMDLNEYRLTRARGYLRPPVTGEYKFWIASDNSSELWLSVNADPAQARKIAYMVRFDWASPREWTRFPSQRSEPIWLKAGEIYYIEALTEQTSGGEYLGVAWQGPGLNQSVIESPYLTPWRARGEVTNGILRECWTNYSAGDLDGMTGARGFKSALTVEKVRVSDSQPGEWPAPEQLGLNQQFPAKENYRWVQVEGIVKFMSADGDAPFFDLFDGQGLIRVRPRHWGSELVKRIRQGPVRVKGVCEGGRDQDEMLTPGLIWATAETSISFPDTVATNLGSPTVQPASATAENQPAVQGFFATRSVVTFNDQILGHDFIFAQKDSAVVLVATHNGAFKDRLKVGSWVDLGGALETGKFTHIPVISPLIVKDLGSQAMPMPVAKPLDFPVPPNQEGQWTEIEGVGHSVNSNGMLSVVGKEGMVCLWVGQTASNYLSRFVDAKLRARGVLMLNLLDVPMLLAPSLNFVNVEIEPPANPFAPPLSSIASLLAEPTESSWPNRVRILGTVTYQDAQSFFVQDATGGIRVGASDQTVVKVGDTVEVIAFPDVNSLVDAQSRRVETAPVPEPKELDLNEALSSKQNGLLVEIIATLLARRTNGLNQVLELQEQRRVFTATLATDQGNLPHIIPGSRIRVTGVWSDETTSAVLRSDKPSSRAQLLAAINILLRSPQDVKVLRGPPWWTWKRTVMLVGMLLTILAVTLLWVHLLRRRLERQQAAQLAFSRQVLERLEDERRRIAANLHDSLGQTLMVIKNHAMLAIQRPPEEPVLRHRLDEISGATSQALEEVRQITHGLRPYQLDRLGLTQAIRASVDRTVEASENNAILFASRVEDIDGLFDKDAEIHVYRIVQEAITNVIKHSAATEAAVVIKKRATVVSLSIRDNGRGFDFGKLSAHPHDLGYGLNGISERARILGATFLVDSRLGSGTSLTVELPLPKKHGS